MLNRPQGGSIPAGAGEPSVSVTGAGRRKVYPRGCGGTGYWPVLMVHDEGLSPRVRGNLHLGLGAVVDRGSIPAGAGEPSGAWKWCNRNGVYPRGCGGTRAPLPGGPDELGLSPRVRGNQNLGGLRKGQPGSIPAGAGEPVFRSIHSSSIRVYPRGCGGTTALARVGEYFKGLSPRVRGNRGRRRGEPERLGSIPAGAGEPQRRTGRSRRAWVYPRGCGGTHFDAIVKLGQTGLSPRVRGNRDLIPLNVKEPGSIPAGAGEPPDVPDRGFLDGVYPRGCGGTQADPPLEPSRGGLSPRVRGNPMIPMKPPRRQGSIPAGAGEPPNLAPAGFPRRVYPRGCGGTTRSATWVVPEPGLSPRVRGNRGRDLRGAADRRSIPAGAGEPLPFPRPRALGKVYPRGCGGTDVLRADLGFFPGLSPRVRGNREDEKRGFVFDRSIPAGAGEPVWRCATCWY